MQGSEEPTRHAGHGGSSGQAIAFMVLAVAVVLATTLLPASAWHASDPAAMYGSFRSSRGTADFIANVLLFAPLGAAAGALWGTWAGALAFGAVLSSLVELAQTWMPGRHSSLLDLAANVLGSVGGALVMRSMPAWLHPGDDVRTRVGTASAIGALALLVGGGWLLAPAAPRGPLTTQWTPSLPGMNAYGGHIESAYAGRVAAYPWPSDDSEALASALLRDTLEIRGIWAAPPAHARLFAIIEAYREPVYTLDVRGADLVVGVRLRAYSVGFGQPAIRLGGVLAGAGAGERLEISAWREGPRHCVRAGSVPSCGGFTMADSWALLVPAATVPAESRTLSGLWVAALFLPAGFWLRPRAAILVGAAAVAVLGATPLLVLVLPTPFFVVAAAAAGLLAGHVLGRGSPGRRSAGPPRGSQCTESGAVAGRA